MKHRPEKPDDVLVVLGDYIVLGSPVDASISFGDLVIAVGLIDLTFRASRRPPAGHGPATATGRTTTTTGSWIRRATRIRRSRPRLVR